MKNLFKISAIFLAAFTLISCNNIDSSESYINTNTHDGQPAIKLHTLRNKVIGIYGTTFLVDDNNLCEYIAFDLGYKSGTILPRIGHDGRQTGCIYDD